MAKAKNSSKARAALRRRVRIELTKAAALLKRLEQEARDAGDDTQAHGFKMSREIECARYFAMVRHG